MQPKHFELLAPFRWSIAQPLDVDASRQAALHGSADQLASKKGERDGHVDMTNAASLAQRNLCSVGDGSRDNLVQPASASCDGADQSEASFRPLRPDLLSRGAVRQQDLPEFFRRWFLPRNGQEAIVGRFNIVCPWVFL